MFFLGSLKFEWFFFYSAGAGYEPVCAGGATHRHARDGRLMKTKGLDGGTHNKTNGV